MKASYRTALLAVICGAVAVSAESDGCTTLENSQYANATITKASLKCAMRGVIAHCGVEVETKHGTYALAYNSKTIPAPVSTPGCVWCQSGGVPMKDERANGNCKGCGGWDVAAHKDASSGSFKTLGEFMKDVKKYADERANYNILACDNGSRSEANCQLLAASMYDKLTGHRPAKCTACESSCFK